MATLTPAGFIIANDAAIISTGTTLTDAIAAYNRDVGGVPVTLEDGTRDFAPMTEDNMGGHIARPATAALLAQVEDVGGAISWEVVDGVACTCDEAALPALTESTDRNWRVVSDGDMEIRVDFTHREKAVEYRLLFIEDHPWIGSPFQGAEFGLDAEDAWRRVSAWLDES